MSTKCIRINFYFYLCLLSYFRKTSHHKTQCHVDLSAVTSSSCVYRLSLALCINPALCTGYVWLYVSALFEPVVMTMAKVQWAHSNTQALSTCSSLSSVKDVFITSHWPKQVTWMHGGREMCPWPWSGERQREHPLSTICLPVFRMFSFSTASRQTQKELLPRALFFSQTKGNRNYLKTTIPPTGHENPKRTVLLKSTRSERMVLKQARGERKSSQNLKNIDYPDEEIICQHNC